MTRDWGGPYARIYATIVEDEKFAEVYDDDRRLAAYVRLLLGAEASYPAPAPLPRWLADDVLDALVAARIIELVRGSMYRVVGLDAERRGRIGGHQVGGAARARTADRDGRGRFSRAGPSDNPATSSKPQQITSDRAPATDQRSSLDRERVLDQVRDSPPNPPPAAGGGSRANGTNPRARAAVDSEGVRQAHAARRYRASQRQLAYLRGDLSNDQRIEMDRRDAPLEEIPGWTKHRLLYAAIGEE